MDLLLFFVRSGFDLLLPFEKIRSYSFGGGLFIEEWGLGLDASYTWYLDSVYGVNYLLVDSPIKFGITWRN